MSLRLSSGRRPRVKVTKQDFRMKLSQGLRRRVLTDPLGNLKK